jgi:hypothetical protein
MWLVNIAFIVDNPRVIAIRNDDFHMSHWWWVESMMISCELLTMITYLILWLNKDISYENFMYVWNIIQLKTFVEVWIWVFIDL